MHKQMVLLLFNFLHFSSYLYSPNLLQTVCWLNARSAIIDCLTLFKGFIPRFCTLFQGPQWGLMAVRSTSA